MTDLMKKGRRLNTVDEIPSIRCFISRNAIYKYMYICLSVYKNPIFSDKLECK